MALKVELKPHERIIVGNCVITNTDQRARLLIDGDNVPILRERDILTPETADTPAKLVYLAVQLMYISPDPQTQHGTYFNLVRDIVTAVPSAWPIIEGINNNILSGDLYRALKDARKLIAYEEKLRDQYEATHPQGRRQLGRLIGTHSRPAARRQRPRIISGAVVVCTALLATAPRAAAPRPRSGHRPLAARRTPAPPRPARRCRDSSVR